MRSPSKILNPTWESGRMHVFENVLPSELVGREKHAYEQVAWAQEQGDAYGCDVFVLIASVIRQIYKRHQQQRTLTLGERGIAQDLLRSQDNDRDLYNLIYRIAVLVAPVSGDTPEEQQASITEYATKHHLLLETLAAGNLTCDAAGKAAPPHGRSAQAPTAPAQEALRRTIRCLPHHLHRRRRWQGPSMAERGSAARNALLVSLLGALNGSLPSSQ